MAISSSNLELKYFRLIDTISTEGTIAKAAGKLFLSQSALSHQLKELETRLGTKVFNRVNKSLILTETGILFQESSIKILEEVENVTKKITEQVNGLSGTIRLGAECNTCFHWLPKVLKQHQRQFPNVEFRLETNGTEPPLNLLLSGKIDIAIVYRKNTDKNITYTELFSDDVVALVPVKHPLAQRKYLTPNDFKGETYITHSLDIRHSIFFEKILQPKKVKPKKVICIQLTETVLEMVSEGIGITAMAKWLIEPYIDSNKISLVKIGRFGLKRKWYITTLKTEDRNLPLIKFTETIQHQVDYLKR